MAISAVQPVAVRRVRAFHRPSQSYDGSGGPAVTSGGPAAIVATAQSLPAQARTIRQESRVRGVTGGEIPGTINADTRSRAPRARGSRPARREAVRGPFSTGRGSRG